MKTTEFSFFKKYMKKEILKYKKELTICLWMFLETNVIIFERKNLLSQKAVPEKLHFWSGKSHECCDLCKSVSWKNEVFFTRNYPEKNVVIRLPDLHNKLVLTLKCCNCQKTRIIWSTNNNLVPNKLIYLFYPKISLSF